MFLNKLNILCALFLVSVVFPVAAVDLGEIVKDEQPQPKIRVMDRDWAYFKSVPCAEVGQLKFHSRSEEMLIAKRKSQCIQRYKAFFPEPVKQSK